MVFWTREASGISARSWHGGEVVPSSSGCDKWLLRKFKEVPTSTFEDLQARASFIENSRRPHLELARAQASGGNENESAEAAGSKGKRKRR